MIKNFSQRIEEIRKTFNSVKNFSYMPYGPEDYDEESRPVYDKYGNKINYNDYDEYGYDEYGYHRSADFTPEEIDLITKACYIIDNVNYALKYPERGSSQSECTPDIDNSYRMLNISFKNQNLINKLFDYNKTKDSYKDLTEKLSEIMKKIRESF